jgi:hypothetical protein
VNLTEWLTLGQWRGAKVFRVPQYGGGVEYDVSIAWKPDGSEIEDEWCFSTGSGVTLEEAFDRALRDPFNNVPTARGAV